MSKLSELYETRKKQYETYKIESAKHQALVDNYIKKINSAEEGLSEKLEALPDDIKEAIKVYLPNLEEPCTPDNARARIEQWRKLYTALESMGMRLLESGGTT